LSDAQNAFNETVLTTEPSFAWMRTCVFSVVIRWFGPAAPAASGGMAVSSSPKARKFSLGAGERETAARDAPPVAASCAAARGRTVFLDLLRNASGMIRVWAGMGDVSSRRARSEKLINARCCATPGLPRTASAAETAPPAISQIRTAILVFSFDSGLMIDLLTGRELACGSVHRSVRSGYTIGLHCQLFFQPER